MNGGTACQRSRNSVRKVYMSRPHVTIVAALTVSVTAWLVRPLVPSSSSLRAAMDESSVPDADTPFITPSVSSILGVKGPLRFRPHGSNQKAHVILRRVTLSDNSSDRGDLSTVVRFSLFAQKRIEVKPGKEILLTVASDDGKFGDLPIVFEGDQASPQTTSEEDSSTQFADEERQGPFNSRVSQAMPPKMRRAWTKKLEVSSSIGEYKHAYYHFKEYLHGSLTVP